jgi:phage antirepressor YoqD-like protein
MCEYGFVENQDFESFSEISEKPQGGRPPTDHAISLDMAKEISMIQRTPKGKEARQYFIACEKKLLSPEYQLAVVRAELQFEREKNRMLGDGNYEKTYDFDEAAALLRIHRKPPFGQNHLKAYLANKGILCKAHYKNSKPIQKYLENGWFRPVVHTWQKRGSWRSETRYLLTNRGLFGKNGLVDMMVKEKFLHLPAPKNECFSFMSEPLPLEAGGAIAVADENSDDTEIEVASIQRTTTPVPTARYIEDDPLEF